jgi:formate dehydrogenase subunit delta
MNTLPPQVRLANEIAVQFHHQPAETAATAIATHIRMFWDPRMRTELITRATTDPTDLDPLVVAAVRLLAP